MSDDEIKKLSSTGEFHYHIELLLSLNYFIKLNDIRMSHLFQNFDFSGNSLYVLLVMDLIFLKNLDGHLFSREGVLAQFDLPEGTFSEVFAYKDLSLDQYFNLPNK